MILRIPRECLKLICKLYVSVLFHVEKLKFSSNLSDSYKLILSILSLLSDYAQCRRRLYFQSQALYLALKHARALIVGRCVKVAISEFILHKHHLFM